MRHRKKGYALIAIGLLLVATTVYIGVGKLLSSDAADLYFEVEDRNFQRLFQSADAFYNAFMEKQRPFLESTNRRRIEATLDIHSGTDPTGVDARDTGAPGGSADLFRSGKLVIDTRSQPQSSLMLSEISLIKGKIPLLEAGLFTDGDRIYLSEPALFDDRYLSARVDQLGEIYDKFSIPVKPTRIINGPAVAKTLRYDKSAFAASVGKLASVFKKHIKPDNVRYGQGGAAQISGASRKGREIIVTLSEEQATSLLHELAFAIAGDDTLLEYTYGNIADMSALLEDAGLFRLYGYLSAEGALSPDAGESDILQKLIIRKDLEGFRQNLQKNAAMLTIKNGLEMTLLVDKAGNILDRKLGFDLLNTGSGSLATLELETGSSNDVFEDPRNRFADLLLTKYRSTGGAANDASGLKKTVELHIRPEFEKPTETGSGGSLALSYLETLQGGDPTGFELKLDIADKMEKTTMTRNSVINYNMRIMAKSGEGTVSGKWNGLFRDNGGQDKRNRTVTLDFNADIPFIGINRFSGTLGLAEEDSFDIGTFSVPAVQPDSVIDLNTAAPEDIERIARHALEAIIGALAGR